MSAYIEHVESLHPKDDDGPLRGFTWKWLLRSTSPWPTSADPRLYTFMHANKFYDPDLADQKELALVNVMRNGTEIEEVQPQQYNMLKERILERVRVLASELQKRRILAYTNEKLQMVKEFKEVWLQRDDYWVKMDTNNQAKNLAANIYDASQLYDDDEDDCVPPTIKKKAISKGKQPMARPKVLELHCCYLHH